MAILERYRERWVAFDPNGAVMANAEYVDELLELLDQMNLVASANLRIPAANEPLFVGLRQPNVVMGYPQVD